jgi:Uma2 family endonuclease
MDRATFHARYLDTPEDFRAELIGGVVHLHGRVTRMHGRAVAELCYALGTYDMATPGVEGLPRVTALLDDETEAEPDLCLRLEREVGGTSWIDEDDFLAGPPECLIEVSDHDTEQLDKCDKFRAYERGGVFEYIVILIREERVLWFVREHGRVRRKPFTARWHPVSPLVPRTPPRHGGRVRE